MPERLDLVIRVKRFECLPEPDRFAAHVFLQAARLTREPSTRDALEREIETLLHHHTTLTPVDGEVTPDG